MELLMSLASVSMWLQRMAQLQVGTYMHSVHIHNCAGSVYAYMWAHKVEMRVCTLYNNFQNFVMAILLGG